MQTVSKHYQGVAMCCHTATSERGRGWAGCLPLYLNARSEASEHAFARRVIPRQDPLHKLPYFGDKFRARRPFIQPFQRQRNYRFASSVTALSHFAFAVQKSPRLAMYFQQPDVPGKFMRHSVPSSAMSCIQYTTSSARLSASDLTS